MNPLSKKLIAALAVTAPLALAGPANAAELFGSDLNQNHRASSVSCSSYPCTLAQRYTEDGYYGYVRDTGVITEWKVKLNQGSQARLKLLREDNWDEFTAIATSPSANGTGGISTVATRIPVEYGDYAGVELQSGLLQTDYHGSDADATEMRFQGAFANAQTRSPDSKPVGQELMSQVKVESDADQDGYGDETQDSCVFCNTGGGGSTGSEVLPPSSSGGSYGSSSGGGSGQTYSQMQDEYAKRPAAKLSIDKRGFFEYRSGKPFVTLYLENEGRKDLQGNVTLKWGKKALPEINKGVNKSYEIESGDDGTLSNFKLPKKLEKAILKKGSVSLTATASMTTEEGAKTAVKQTIAVRKAGMTNAFDGTWRGTGGLVIQVSGGYLTSINVGLNAYCQGSRRFMQQSLYTLGGYPLMINRDGSFAAKGSNSPNSIRYEGKLTRKGAAKGYLSLFHTKLESSSGGRLNIDQCFAASNWTATRAKK